MKPVALITDFGAGSSYAGSLKGAVLTHCGTALLVDVSHQVPAHSQGEGAFLLDCVFDDFPEGTVFLVVVDPGVGTERPAIAAKLHARYFVGPDNGLLALLLRRYPLEAAVQIERTFVPAPSATFEGRDVFAPAAAWLACGKPLAALGPEVEALQAGAAPSPVRVSEHSLLVQVLHVDAFGNVILSLRQEDLPASARLVSAYIAGSRRQVAGFVRTYADLKPAELGALVGSTGWVELALDKASAAAKLQLAAGDRLELVFD